MKRPRVALLINCARHPWRDLVSGICRFARAHGQWEFIWVQDSPLTPRSPLKKATLDGLIVSPGSPWSEGRIASLGVPALSVGDTVAQSQMPVVTFDAAAIGALAAEHFLERGFRHFAFCGMGEFAFSQRRGAAFAERLPRQPEWLRLPLRADWEVPPAHLSKSLRAWLDQLPRPCGLFCATDFVARLCAEVCFQSRLRVPEDVAILGVNNETLHCELSPVPLSSINLGAANVGYEAARRLHLWMCEGIAPQSTFMPPQRVICRQSSDLMAIEDALIVRALHLMRERFQEPLRVDEICRAVGLSRRVFELRFRAALGRSPYAEVTRLRYERARELLVNSDATLAHIALRSGFASPNEFHRAFKAHSGQTPGAFRKNHNATLRVNSLDGGNIWTVEHGEA